MGLASTLSTALTGLSAAEATFDVVGNNLANANTVGFKASQVNFATQFLQTLSLGSAPSANSGGTDPRQIGLGTMVTQITPNFSQGTIQISSTPTDLAIQGDGFFIVQGASGEHLYTRNGVFKLNAANEIVTTTGERLLGFGVNDQFQIQPTSLVPLTIPLGSSAVAQATSNVYLEGQLSPTGDIATTAERIRTGTLSNGEYSAPDANADATAALAPNVAGAGTSGQSQPGGGMTAGDTYEYRFVYASQPASTATPPTIPPFSEGTSSTAITATVAAGEGSILLQNIDINPAHAGPYSYINIYRRDTTAGGTDYNYVGEVPMGTTAGETTTFPDSTDNLTAAANPVFDTDTLNGKYEYYVTYATSGGGPGNGIESRPNLDLTPSTVNVVNGRVTLTNLPTVDPNDNPSAWTVRRIYRCLAADDTKFYYVGEISDATSAVTFTDSTPDDTLVAQDSLLPNGGQIDLDGPKIDRSTKLVDVLSRDGNAFDQVFHAGTLHFTGQKGGTTLATKDFTITAGTATTPATTVQDLYDFMSQAMGIQQTSVDPTIPYSQTDVPGVDVPPGGDVDAKGRITLTGNNGVDNAIAVQLSGLSETYMDSSGQERTEAVNLPFSGFQTAIGESATADTLVYDSLGTSLSLRLTTVLESRDNTVATYRWFADSADNSSNANQSIAVGTGTISFDTSGNFKSASNSTVTVHRDGYPAINPLVFNLDFSKITALATPSSSLAVARQDGFGPGTLSSFIVGEDGTITGVFSNGADRDLGQVRLSRFANPAGLEQRGRNLYAAGVDSGLAVEGNPGQRGIGSLVAGAQELSNTDVGTSLIDLVLGSTMYRGNARVITTVEQMFDELLAMLK